MPELADLLERESRRVDPAPGGFERLTRRRERRERNRRVGAGVLALVVTVAVVAAFLRANETRERPASPSVTQASPSDTPHEVTGFPGLPPAGAKPSEPITGTLELSYYGPDGRGNEMDLQVYADGRMIWQRWSPSSQPLVIPNGATAFSTAYVWQRLTPGGVDRLRSTLLSSGLFDSNKDFLTTVTYQIRVRTGGRIFWVWSNGNEEPTQAQRLALDALQNQLADPASWLPPSDWADVRVRAFVPACYSVAWEGGGVNLAKLPAVASAELRKHVRRNASGSMTTDEARTLIRALVAAGFTPSHETSNEIGFNLPPHGGYLEPHADPGQWGDGYLHLSPGLPDKGC
jgi:hypothetical protein